VQKSQFIKVQYGHNTAVNHEILKLHETLCRVYITLIEQLHVMSQVRCSTGICGKIVAFVQPGAGKNDCPVIVG